MSAQHDLDDRPGEHLSPLAKVQGSPSFLKPGLADAPLNYGVELRNAEARAKTQLNAILARSSANHAGYSAQLRSLSLGVRSGRMTIAIEARNIWGRVSGHEAGLKTRIEQALQEKYGGVFEVEITEGSITIAIIYSALETMQHIYNLVTSVGTIVEYTIRCIENSRWEWPPIPSMFTFFESLKKIFLGL